MLFQKYRHGSEQNIKDTQEINQPHLDVQLISLQLTWEGSPYSSADQVQAQDHRGEMLSCDEPPLEAHPKWDEAGKGQIHGSVCPADHCTRSPAFETTGLQLLDVLLQDSNLHEKHPIQKCIRGVIWCLPSRQKQAFCSFWFLVVWILTLIKCVLSAFCLQRALQSISQNLSQAHWMHVFHR